jgi:hypothetical protein
LDTVNVLDETLFIDALLINTLLIDALLIDTFDEFIELAFSNDVNVVVTFIEFTERLLMDTLLIDAVFIVALLIDALIMDTLFIDALLIDAFRIDTFDELKTVVFKNVVKN